VSLELAVTAAVALAALALLVRGRPGPAVVALAALAVLVLARVIPPEAALAGFANPATVAIGALFVVAAGLERTGAIAALGDLLLRLPWRSPRALAVVVMLLAGTLSAFINNTAAVAILLPAVVALARGRGVSPSKLLLPLSFAAMFGGVTTLVGTSTNLVLSALVGEHGGRPFGFFEFAPVGLVFFATGIVYLATVGFRLLPARRPATGVAEVYGVADYLAEVVVEAESDVVGRRLAELELPREEDLDVVEVARGGRRVLAGPETRLEAGDILRVRADLSRIEGFASRHGLRLEPREDDERVREGDLVLVDAVVGAGSPLVGRSLRAARFRERYGATVLAIAHRGTLRSRRLSREPLVAGDLLLLEAPSDRIEELARDRSFVLVSAPRGAGTSRPGRRALAIGWTVAAIVAVVAGVAPMSVAALAGATGMILTRCLSLEEALRSIDGSILVLLAGMLALGRALEATGGAAWLAEGVVAVAGGIGPWAVVAALYVATTLLTETLSNVAAAALLAPIAFATAEAMSISPRPLVMAIAFAASASFLTPFGYQTNLLVYGPGRYRFTDFARVGAPLNLLFWIVATALIPLVYPF